MAIFTGPDDSAEMTVSTGKVGLQMSDVRIGPIGSRTGVGIHRRSVEPFLTGRPTGDYRIGVAGLAITFMPVT